MEVERERERERIKACWDMQFKDVRRRCKTIQVKVIGFVIGLGVKVCIQVELVSARKRKEMEEEDARYLG